MDSGATIYIALSGRCVHDCEGIVFRISASFESLTTFKNDFVALMLCAPPWATKQLGTGRIPGAAMHGDASSCSVPSVVDLY
jgi:hypothetical protein